MRKTFELVAFVLAVAFLLVIMIVVQAKAQQPNQPPLTLYETPVQPLDLLKEKMHNQDGIHTRLLPVNCFERKTFENIVNAGVLQMLTSGFTNPTEEPSTQLYSAILRDPDPEKSVLVVVVTASALPDGKVCVVSLFEPIKKNPPTISGR